MENKTFKIIIADSQILIVKGIEFILKDSDTYAIACSTDNIHDLNRFLKQENADLLITDFTTIDYNAFDSLKLIIKEYPKLKILILTSIITKPDLQELTKLGIKNIIYKTTDQHDFLSAIEASLKSKKFYSDEVFDMLTENSHTNQRKDTPEINNLTPSEIEIVKLIAEGFTTKEIAEKKHISFHTVMSHRKNIFRKLSVNNASELVIFAVRAGIVDAIEYYI